MRKRAMVALVPVFSVAAMATAINIEPAMVHVVIGSRAGAVSAVELTVKQHGGRVTRRLNALDVMIADVPRSALSSLAHSNNVTSMAVSAPVRLDAAGGNGNGNGKGRGRTQADANTSAIGVDSPRSQGFTGAGIDVAVIDSGVSPVPGLAGRVVNAPDFSADAAVGTVTSLDAYGHGTHLAGLIAGNDPTTGFTGVAPQSRIVNVKVAAHDGSTTVENVLSGINWVIENAGKGGLNIRVLNLSLGLDAEDTYVGDPLAQAVEKAWKKDITVVVSAGNAGASSVSLQSPAVSPYIIAVAAEDTKATADTSDDTIADFTSNGSSTRTPDLVAPGVGMVSLRVPGSALDDAYPDARIDDTLFRGNGTSQAAAITSGAVALLLQNNPKMNPDQAKAILMGTATPIAGVPATRQGAGRLSVAAAVSVSVPEAKQVTQKWDTAGKIDLKKLDKLNGKAKGGKTSKSLEAEGLTGNRWTGNRWTGNRWTGNRWTGNGWS
jgi:serine protease AprX